MIFNIFYIKLKMELAEDAELVTLGLVSDNLDRW